MPDFAQPFAPGSTTQIAQTTGFRDVERYEVQEDETRTNTTVMADSRWLVVPVGAGEMIIFKAVIVFGYGASPGQAQFQFASPALTSAGYGGFVHPIGVGYAFVNSGIATFNAPVVLAEDNAGAGDLYPNFVWGQFQPSANGEFKVQWAQNGASATPTTLVRGSSIEVWRR